MHKEEANFKRDLVKSCNAIILSINPEANLYEKLTTKWEFHFERFERETREVYLASKYKSSVRKNLQSFANEKINEMYEKNRTKNEGEYFFFFLPFC